MTDPRLPYFDHLLSELARGNQALNTSFGRHVHWGLWDDPRAATGTDEDYARAAENLTVQLCTLAQMADGQRVLDAGCGFGGTIASLNAQLQHMDMTGLNIDPRQLARAREQVHARGDNRIAFIEGDACALPFPDASFDRVLAVECIFHFPSREKFFQEAQRVLKPGGILALSDFIPSPLFVPVTSLVNSKFFEKYNVYGHSDVSTTRAGYARLAARTGFAVPAMRDVTRNTLPTYDYLHRNSRYEVLGGWMKHVARFQVGLQKRIGAAKLLTYQLAAFRKL